MLTERTARAYAVIELLAECWPAAFAVYEQRRRPLRIGIHVDIMAALDGAITPEELKLGLGYYTNNIGYLRALRDGTARIDLAGNAAGTVSADDAQRAVDRLVAFKKIRQRQRANPTEVTMPVPAETKMVVKPVLGRLSLVDLKQAALRRRQSEVIEDHRSGEAQYPAEAAAARPR